MSTRYNNGSNYENHQRAAELHNAAAHAHRVAEQRGKQDHLSNHDHSHMAFEHSQDAHRQSQKTAAVHIQEGLKHAEIAALAYHLWLERGCRDGASDEDWFQATALLLNRLDGHAS